MLCEMHQSLLYSLQGSPAEMPPVLLDIAIRVVRAHSEASSELSGHSLRPGSRRPRLNLYSWHHVLMAMNFGRPRVCSSWRIVFPCDCHHNASMRDGHRDAGHLSRIDRTLVTCTCAHDAE